MTYDHAVTAFGKYYPAGAEVPAEAPETAKKKPERTRKTDKESKE
jgi:hypothetical protein